MEPMALLAFKVVIEPDEDEWQSYYPAWVHLGAATCGDTREEAAANIKEVLEMIVEEIEEGEIEWPVEPGPHSEFSKPSIQDQPELMQLNCALEHTDAIASHGGLPVFDSESGTPHCQVYRLIYVGIEDVLASIHERRTWRETRTGGLVSRIFGASAGLASANGAAQKYVSSGKPGQSKDPAESHASTVSDR